jgi:hypothetical protein
MWRTDTRCVSRPNPIYTSLSKQRDKSESSRAAYQVCGRKGNRISRMGRDNNYFVTLYSVAAYTDRRPIHIRWWLGLVAAGYGLYIGLVIWQSKGNLNRPLQLGSHMQWRVKFMHLDVQCMSTLGCHNIVHLPCVSLGADYAPGIIKVLILATPGFPANVISQMQNAQASRVHRGCV